MLAMPGGHRKQSNQSVAEVRRHLSVRSLETCGSFRWGRWVVQRRVRLRIIQVKEDSQLPKALRRMISSSLCAIEPLALPEPYPRAIALALGLEQSKALSRGS